MPVLLFCQYNPELDVRGESIDGDSGELQLSNSDASHFLRLYGGRSLDPNPFIYFRNTDKLRFATGGPDFSSFTELMTLKSGPMLGLGTSDPARVIHIKGTGGVSDDVIIESNSSSANAGLLGFFRSFGTADNPSSVPFEESLGKISWRAYQTVFPQAGFHELASLEVTGGQGSFGPVSTVAGRMVINIESSKVLEIGDFGLEIHQNLNPANGGGNYGLQLYGMNNEQAGLVIDPDGNLTISFDGERKAFINRVSGDYMATSDRRIKNNLRDLDPVLEKVLQLRPRNYYLISDDLSRKQIGVVAQELETVLPELVSQEAGIKGVAYSKLSVVALKAIQEQQALITNLSLQLEKLNYHLQESKRKVDTLQTKVDTFENLEKRIVQLESSLKTN